MRATEHNRDLLDRAAAALGTDRSSFLLAQGRLAAQRVLADRERINSRPARSLPDLARLLDVITREASLSDAIGCRGLLVHAECEQARGFDEHLIPEFERSPTDPLHLLLLLKDIRRTLRR